MTDLLPISISGKDTRGNELDRQAWCWFQTLSSEEKSERRLDGKAGRLLNLVQLDVKVLQLLRIDR